MKDERERCFPLGKENAFQCVPERANFIRWSDIKKWEYKVNECDEWSSAPTIGANPNKFVYTPKIRRPFMLKSARNGALFGIITLALGLLLLLYNEMNGVRIESLSPLISEWVIAIIMVMLVLYLYALLVFKLQNKH